MAQRNESAVSRDIWLELSATCGKLQGLFAELADATPNALGAPVIAPIARPTVPAKQTGEQPISLNKGQWKPDELLRLTEALAEFGSDLPKVVAAVGTRNSKQVKGRIYAMQKKNESSDTTPSTPPPTRSLKSSAVLETPPPLPTEAPLPKDMDSYTIEEEKTPEKKRPLEDSPMKSAKKAKIQAEPTSQVSSDDDSDVPPPPPISEATTESDAEAISPKKKHKKHKKKHKKHKKDKSRRKSGF